MAKNDKTKDMEVVLRKFLELLVTSSQSYSEHYQKVSDCDKASQDLLHALELDDSAATKSTLKKLVEIRRVRRYAKDMCDLLYPMHDYYQKNKSVINETTNLIGSIRRAQKVFDNRKYTPRILTSMKIKVREVLK